MEARLTRFKDTVKLIFLLVRNREFGLLFHLRSIDYHFYAQIAAGQKAWLSGSYHPLFDPDYYRTHYLDNTYRGIPFIHFLKEGIGKGYKPGPFFDYDVYRLSTGWQPGGKNPLEHYLTSGYQSCRPGVFFDARWYKDKTPILHREDVDLVKHYRLNGCIEGKSPIPLFDPQFYRQFIPENETGADPLSHYLTYGIDSDKPPCPLFDPVYYRKQYESELGECSPFAHYLTIGVHEGNYTTAKIAKLKYKPLISIVVPVYNARLCFLNNAIRSVLYQQYPHWQLCLADDGSTSPGIREQLEYWQKQDERISIVFQDSNQGISIASNSAAALANGEYLGFLDNDDELTLDALAVMAQAISEKSADLLYSDEDLIGEDGRRFSIFFKPDFNRALLYSHNYITHLIVISRKLFTECHGFRSDYDGAQDFDLMLRAAQIAKNIVHIPSVLYHWRAAKTSTSINHDQKDYAHDAGKRALQGCFNSPTDKVVIEDGDVNYSYRVKRSSDTVPSVTVLLWSEGTTGQIEDFRWLKDRTAYDNCEILVITEAEVNGEENAAPVKSSLSEDVSQLLINGKISKAEALSEGIALSDSEFLVFLDSSVTDVNPGWLRELVSQMEEPNTGVVCGRFSYPDGDGPSYTIPVIHSESARYYYHFLTSCSRHLNGLHCLQFLRFAAGEISIIRRSDYDRLGGFDSQHYPSLFTLTDFALRAEVAGLTVLYTPYAKAVGKQIFTEADGTEKDCLHTERKTFQNSWKTVLDQLDPYYNLGILDENNIDRDVFIKWFTQGEVLSQVTLDVET